MVDRIALGTAQFGLPYGVANHGGQVTSEEAGVIVGGARAAGIDTLDTAIAYGNSEQCLGGIGMQAWRVVTKLPALPKDAENVNTWVCGSVNGSLARLGVPSVAGLLLHHSIDLVGSRGAALAGALRRERDQGRATKIGISIYEPAELDAVWPVLIPDIVQAPFSVIDRRLESSGWLTRLHEAGVEVHTRSTFLQGLLMMTPTERPNKFGRWTHVWSEWADWLAMTGMSALCAAIGHCLSYAEISRVVVGVDSAAQLAEIVEAAVASAARAPASLATNDSALLDPSRWASL